MIFLTREALKNVFPTKLMIFLTHQTLKIVFQEISFLMKSILCQDKWSLNKKNKTVKTKELFYFIFLIVLRVLI
jgi:hypothetical protein